MPQLPPVVLLAFANAKDAYLDSLEAEQKALQAALRDAHARGQIWLEICFSTTVADIFDAFARYRDRIAVFHYAGHANGYALELRDTQAFAAGFADLIRAAPVKPELVFLNGCATGGQVQGLLQAGSRAVIATAAPINDDAARIFSTRFYKALAVQASVSEAYDTACAELNTLGKLPPHLHRSLTWDGKDAPDAEASLWGLYGTGDWKLPLTFQASTAGEELDLDLKKLVNPVFKEMLDRYGFGREIGQAEKSLRPQLIRQALVKAFPLTVGRELEVLFQTASREQLPEQVMRLLLVYLRMTQFHACALLAQAWDAARKGDLSPTPASRELVTAFARADRAAWPHFRYDRLAAVLTENLKQAGIEPFIPEGNDPAGYQRAISALESVRARALQSPLNTAEAAALFNDTVGNTASVLAWHVAMVDNFSLVSVKDVVLKQSRALAQIYYVHQLSSLAKVVKEGTVFTDLAQPLAHTDSFSVLLIRYDDNRKYIGRSLSLSPFFVDVNAFEEKSEIPRLMVYGYADGKGRYYEDTQEKQHPFISGAHLRDLAATAVVTDEDDPFGETTEQETDPFALPGLLTTQFNNLLETFRI